MILQNPELNHIDTDQTIIALCTASGAGSIGLIRLSGTDALTIADRMAKLASGKKITDHATHSIAYGWVTDQNQTIIDQVLFLIMHGPKTFTGQNVVEITCHNNPFLIEQIIDRALACGARPAGKGEFTQRAVLAGKIDLLQAEAIHDLITAQTSQALKHSMAQLQGSLSSWIAQIEEQVLEILAFCEGSFEFLDEEMEFAPDIRAKLEKLMHKIQELLLAYPKQQYIKEGIKIALIGSVNAGKSSLFNALIKKDRAIVTPIPGTTRDSIEASLFNDGEFLTFIDTAGIRQTDDVIEQHGIDRSFVQAAHADIILLVLDQSRESNQAEIQAYKKIMDEYASKVMVIFNKIDLPAKLDSNPHKDVSLPSATYVSTHQPDTVQILLQTIKAKAAHLKDQSAVTCLLSKRQHDLLVNFYKHIQQCTPMLEKKQVDYELISYQLQESLKVLCEMTGRAISQAAFDKVFDTFCVGK
jgi:tRNA modification GTPase